MSRQTSHGLATVTQACAAFGISRQAYYAARSRTPATDGPDRLREAAPRERSRASGSRAGGARPGPTHPAWVPTEDLRAAIHEVVRENVAWGVRKAWAVLRRRGLRAGIKRVWAIMKADGLTLEPAALRESPGRYGRVAVPESNRRWATDLTTVWTRLDRTVAVVPVIDCGDRFGLALEVSRSQESGPVLAPTEEALRREFGLPERVPDGLEWRTDHGPQFTGGDADELCRRWRLDQTLAPVGRPTGNAIAERFIETMKVEVIWTRDWESAAELDAALQAWLLKYNHERPHQSLGWATPAEKRASNLGLPLVAAA
jgi:putative transposase